MTELLLQFLGGIPPILAVFLLSMSPIVELRAAIPIGIGVYHFPLALLLPLVIFGNMIPALLILYGWDWIVLKLAKHWPWLHRIYEKWYQKTQVQWDQKIEKYGPWALIIFVAIPLPGSGVWSGAFAAWAFNLEKKKAIGSIFIGVILASILMTTITLGGVEFIKGKLL